MRCFMRILKGFFFFIILSVFDHLNVISCERELDSADSVFVAYIEFNNFLTSSKSQANHSCNCKQL